MKPECHLKIAVALLALVACWGAGATAQAQNSNVRVGPGTDDAAAAPPAKKEPTRAGPKPTAKTEQPAARKSGGEARPEKEARTEGSVAGAHVVSADVPKSASSDPAAPPLTTDAPARKSDPPVQVLSPKSTLSVEKVEGEGSSGAGASAANADGPAVPAAGPNGVTPAPVAASNNWSAPPAPSPTSVYRVGVGDVLDIRLFNQPPRESTLFTVMGGGLIEYPLAGEPINVSGMTAEEVGVRVASELRRRAVYDKIPQVFVTVREYASHTVMVSGLVADPGVKVLRREAVPLYVIIAEAQPKPEAGRAMVLSHATGQSTSVDLSDTQALNLLVHPSDVVNVVARPQEFFYIGGEIASPGQKTFYTGMTLTQAVLASGGATRNASGRVRVSRQGADGRLTSAQYVLSNIQAGKVPDPTLMPGDRVEVERGK
jgi:protein involved in polysaccharide export with SLBB domain